MIEMTLDKRVVLYDNYPDPDVFRLELRCRRNIRIDEDEEAEKVLKFFQDNVSAKLFHKIAKLFIQYEAQGTEMHPATPSAENKLVKLFDELILSNKHQNQER